MNNFISKVAFKSFALFILMIYIIASILTVDVFAINNEGESITDYNDENSVVKSISLYKNSIDADQSQYFYSSSLPFSVEVRLKDSVKGIFSDFHALILFKSSFSSNFKSSFEYNSLTNSFTLNDIVFDGRSNVLFFAISDGTINYYKEFLIPIKNAVISGQNPDDSGGTFPDGKSNANTDTTSKTTTEKEPSSLKPHLILHSHNIEFSKTDSLSFDLTLEFYNTSENLTAQNIVLNFSPDKYDSSSMPLYLNNSDSNKYIEKIPPKGKKKVVLSFSINKDMDIPVYLLGISADFQYIENIKESPVSTTDKSILTINPYVGGSLRIDSIHTPVNIILKEDFEIEYRIANTGFSPLTNVDIFVSDSSDKRVATMFLGKIPANEVVASPNIKLNIKKTGDFTLTFTVSYLDEKNKKHVLEKDFRIIVRGLDEQNLSEDVLDNPTIIIEQPKKRFGNDMVGGFILSSIILITLYGISKIFRRKTNESEESEEDLLENLNIQGANTDEMEKKNLSSTRKNKKKDVL